MKTNVLYILDMIPWTGEFKWFVIESFYALDSANVNLWKIKKRLNWAQLAPSPPSLNLQQIIKFLFTYDNWKLY